MASKRPTFNQIINLFTQLKDRPVPKYVIIGYPYAGDQLCPYSRKAKQLLSSSHHASDYVFVILPNRDYGRDFKNYFGYNGTFPLVYKDQKYIGGASDLEMVLEHEQGPTPSLSDKVEEQYPISEDSKAVLVGFHPHQCPFSRMALDRMKQKYYPGEYQAFTFDRSDSQRHRIALDHKGTFPLIFKKGKDQHLELVGGATDFMKE